MDDIIKMVQDKTGLSEDKARMAVNTVVGFIKDKLPAPIAAQVENVIGNKQGSDVLGGFMK